VVTLASPEIDATRSPSPPGVVGLAWRGVGLVLTAAVFAVLAEWLGVRPIEAVWNAIPNLAVVVAVLGGVAFLALKSMALQLGVRAAGREIGETRAARTLCEGIAVETVTWPGKAWADAYRVARLRGRDDVRASLSLAEAAVGVGIARAGALISGSLFGLAALITLSVQGAADSATVDAAWIKIGLAAGCIGFTLMAAWGIRRLRLLPRGVRWSAAAGSLAAAVFASLADLVSVSIVCLLVAGVSPSQLWPHVVLVGIVATAAALPLGIGVIDAGLFLVLTQRLGADERSAVAAIACVRACGPGLSVTLGVLSLLARAVVRPGSSVPPGAHAHRPFSPHTSIAFDRTIDSPG
jgi:hypothetical protein